MQLKRRTYGSNALLIPEGDSAPHAALENAGADSGGARIRSTEDLGTNSNVRRLRSILPGSDKSQRSPVAPRH
ncbi:hypothetical protein FIBSPDRAFT_877741 [Athelia psychrophila]|uniref:Uncharacterized protein n=1 Tax=Athelia psychrophila TaxID=1759441 RepID=A0A167VQN8_9AGAM|nr:hypothetical protein FIBSPDRAFT_877741 [Fibularhizoctonia sp. CBS 109695]